MKAKLKIDIFEVEKQTKLVGNRGVTYYHIKTDPPEILEGKYFDKKYEILEEPPGEGSQSITVDLSEATEATEATEAIEAIPEKQIKPFRRKRL